MPGLARSGPARRLLGSHHQASAHEGEILSLVTRTSARTDCKSLAGLERCQRMLWYGLCELDDELSRAAEYSAALDNDRDAIARQIGTVHLRRHRRCSPSVNRTGRAVGWLHGERPEISWDAYAPGRR